MANTYNYVISGIIAFSIYLLLILVFILYLQTPKVKTYQAISDDTIIQLEIITEEVIKDKKELVKVNKKVEVKEKVVEDIKVDKSSSSSANKKSNLKSLFANVSTESKKVKVKKVLNIKKNEISSRFKSKLEKNKKRTQLKIKKSENIKSEKSNKKINITNKNGNFDKYYSKINSIILNRWYKYPLLTTESYLVKVQIKITNQGLFSYNIMSYSGNLNIDDSVKDFLDTQTNEVYPFPIDGKTKNIIINFINEKKEI